MNMVKLTINGKVWEYPDGITYKEDKPQVMAAIRALKAQGLYPEKLWEDK